MTEYFNQNGPKNPDISAGEYKAMKANESAQIDWTGVNIDSEQFQAILDSGDLSKLPDWLIQELVELGRIMPPTT